jgi:hypothetical protein
VDSILAAPGMNHNYLIDETAVRIFGGRNMTCAKIGADGVWIDSSGEPQGLLHNAGRLVVRWIAPPALFCREGQDDPMPPWFR